MTTLEKRKQANAAYYANNKNHVVSIRLDDNTMAIWNRMAAETTISKNALLRSILSGATIKTPNPKVTDDVLRELSAIGNNLNQLAKAKNEADRAGVQLSGIGLRLDEVKKQLDEIKAKL